MEQGIERTAFSSPFDDIDEGPEVIDNKKEGGGSPDNGDQNPPTEEPEKGDTEEQGQGAEGSEDVKPEIEREEINVTDGSGTEEDDDKGETKPPSGQEDDDKSHEPSKNDIYNVAMHWKKEGYLPEDVEINEDITDAELTELYRKAKEEPLVKTAEERALENLKQQGYTDKELRNARLLAQGIDPRTVIEADNYEKLSKLKMPENEEERLRLQRQLLEIDYRDQGITDEKRIKRLIDISIEEGDIDDEVAKVQQRFGEAANAQIEEFKAKKAEQKKKQEQRQKENIERIQNYIKTRKVGDEKYSEKVMNKVNDALFKKDQVYEVGGKKKKGTLWQKIQDLKQNDPDFAMKMIIRQIAADELAPDPEEIERRHSDRILYGLSGGSSTSTGGSESKRSAREEMDKSGIERKPLI